MCFDEYTIRQPRIIRMAHLRPKTCDGHQKLLVTGNTFYQKLLIASNTFHVADRKMAQIEERESLMEREENAAKRKIMNNP